MTRRHPTRNSAFQSLRLPLALAALTFSGLAAGLMGSGGWDLYAAFGIGAACAVVIWYWRPWR